MELQLHCRLQTLSTPSVGVVGYILHWQRQAPGAAAKAAATFGGQASAAGAGAAAAAAAAGAAATAPLAATPAAPFAGRAAASLGGAASPAAPASTARFSRASKALPPATGSARRDSQSLAEVPPPPTSPAPSALKPAMSAVSQFLRFGGGGGSGGNGGDGDGSGGNGGDGGGGGGSGGGDDGAGAGLGAASSVGSGAQQLLQPSGATPAAKTVAIYDPAGDEQASLAKSSARGFGAGAPQAGNARAGGGSTAKSGAGSVVSRESGKSSASYVGKSVNKLRRIISVEHPPMLPSLQRLRAAGVLLLLIAIVLAAVLNFVTASNFSLISSNLLYSRLASKRTVEMSSALTSAQRLVARGRGWTNVSAPDAVLERGYIYGNTSDFMANTLSMSALVAQTKIAWTWTRRYITLTQFQQPTSGIYNPNQVVNQLETSNAFASLMTQLSSPVEMPDASFAEWSSGSAWGEPHLASMNVDFMRGGNGFETISACVQTSFSFVIEVLSTISSLQQNVFLGMLCASFALSAFVLFPIVRLLDFAGDDIMLQFVHIPAEVRRVLHEVAQKRMRLLRRNYDDDDDARSESEPEEDGEGGKADGEGGAYGVDPMSTTQDDDSGTIHTGRLLQVLNTLDSEATRLAVDSAAGGGAAGGGKGALPAPRISRRAQKRNARLQYKKSAFAFWATFLRYISPLVLLLTLFSTVFGTFLSQSEVTRQHSSLAIASGVRASCSRQAIVDLRKLAMLTTSSDYIYRCFFFVMGSLDCVRNHVRLLAYGNLDPSLAEKEYVKYVGAPESAGGAPYLSRATTTKAYQAMFGDACGFLDSVKPAGSFFNMSQCQAFGGGVMHLGLAAAVERWWSAGYTVADRQLKVRLALAHKRAAARRRRHLAFF